MPKPKTKPEDNITAAFTEMAPRYEQTVDKELKAFWGWSYAAFIESLVREVHLEDGDRVLDIATGTAVIPLALAGCGKDGMRINGLDITPAMLVRARDKVVKKKLDSIISLVCATAMKLPYASSAFDGVVCGLATHHLDIDEMLREIHRVLIAGGSFTLGDVGGADYWNIPGFKVFLRILGFVYYLINENFKRAWAEAMAIPNVLTADEWRKKIIERGFHSVDIIKLKSKKFWAPDPIIIKAIK
jgi:ubiquinone/menaquinone biosynthesis C-methylase UbiE